MKKFRLFNLLFLFLSISSLSFGQIEIKWKDVYASGENLVVKVFAQNLGQGFEFWNQYGYYGNKDEANFYLEYNLLRENRRIKVLPQTVLIETVFGTVVEMDTPTYYFPSTGSSAGQSWEIVFRLPNDVSDAVLTIFGKRRAIQNSDEADMLEKKLKEEFMRKKDVARFDFKKLNYTEWVKIDDKLSGLLNEFRSRFKKGFVKGTLTIDVDKLGETNIDLNINNRKLEKSIVEAFSNFKLKSPEKYGHKVNAEAIFDFKIGKGDVKIEIDEEGIKKFKPADIDHYLKGFIEKRIKKTPKGKHLFIYDIYETNGEDYSKYKIYKLGFMNLIID